MKFSQFLVYGLCFAFRQAAAKVVFAHFMVGNTANYQTSDWEDDITKAQEAHIDAFALNIAKGESMNDASLAAVFSVAESKGFKLFFSFDYAGRGPWDSSIVTGLINKWAASSAYYRHQGQPFVSTFEGPEQADDWLFIKAATGCFFVPDWSSLGAAAAMQKCGGCADGLFSWAAWAWGDKDMDDYVDASYHDFLGGKPYMMSVSPWFYTNLPGYDKNWLWRGDHTWYDRWIQVFSREPEWVEIISWNDYGESHHIGPIRDHAMDAFTVGEAPYNYALQHDGWRSTLPHVIDIYKNDVAHIDTEGISFWYRLHPNDACTTGGTSGNTALQLQYEFEPADVLQDAVFFTAILASKADVEVTIGGESGTVYWRNKPEGGVGMWHGYSGVGSRTGTVEIKLHRGGDVIAQVTGEAITTSCQKNVNNYDAWVGSQFTKRIPAVTTPPLSSMVCVDGWAVDDFLSLCSYSCGLGYCPPGACVCRAMGSMPKRPDWTGVNGYPAEGLSGSYGGLCGFDCGFGYCPSKYCGTTQYPAVEPRVSPFLPPTCTSGTAEGAYEALCSFTCSHGFCPIAVCKCLSQGPLNLLDPTTPSIAKAWQHLGDDHGLCAFACARGNCLSDVCDSLGGLPGRETQDPTPAGPDLSIPHPGEDCYRYDHCEDLNDRTTWSCNDGYEYVGWDLDVCKGLGGQWGKPICCKSSDLPMDCIWRGGGSDCNGQCHSGEVTLFESGDGGWPTESNDDQCTRGYKNFCCELRTFDDLTGRCRWTGCAGSCADDEQDVAYAYNLGMCTIFNSGQHYCCQDEQKPLDNCHWVGQGDCADNTCNSNEVTLAVNSQGDSYSSCGWYRNKALCCTANDAVFEQATCSVQLCDSEFAAAEGFSCGQDPYADDMSDEDLCEDPESSTKRDDYSTIALSVPANSTADAASSLLVLESPADLIRRGTKRPYEIKWEWLNAFWTIVVFSRAYPGSSHLHDSTRSTPATNLAFRMRDGCTSTDIITVDTTTLNSTERAAHWDTEHNPDLQYIRDFVYTLGSGILPDGTRTANNAFVHGQDIESYWNARVLGRNLPQAGSSRCIRTPNDHFMDRFGSQGNRYPLLLCERNLNQMKGILFNLDQTKKNAAGDVVPTDPMNTDNFQILLRRMIRGDVGAQDEIFEHLRVVIAVFVYINHPDAQRIIQHNRRELQAAADTISAQVGAFSQVGAIHREFNINWYRRAADLARTWVGDRLIDVIGALNTAANTSPQTLPPNWRSINETVTELYDDLQKIQAPPDP